MQNWAGMMSKFTDVFDNDMMLSTAATGNLWCKASLAARQVLRQDATCGT